MLGMGSRMRVLIGADMPELAEAAETLRNLGADVTALEVDLATRAGK